MCWAGQVCGRLGWRRSWRQIGLWMPGCAGNPCHMEGTQPGPRVAPLSSPCSHQKEPSGSALPSPPPPAVPTCPRKLRFHCGQIPSILGLGYKKKKKKIMGGNFCKSSLYIETLDSLLRSYLGFFFFLQQFDLYFVLMERNPTYFCCHIHQSVRLTLS